jgi:hypothetical protein
VKKRVKKQWLALFKLRSIWETICQEIRDSDEESFKKWTRLTREEFDVLAKKVAPYVEKQQTTFKTPISVDKRLAITLVYLATGSTFMDLSVKFAVGYSTVSTIVRECLNALCIVLKPFLQCPDSPEKWKVNFNFG